MKKLSIKTAILIPSITVLAVGIALMATVAGVLSARAARTLTGQLIEATVDEHANEFESLCGGIYEAVAAATPIVAQYRDAEFTQNIAKPREEVINILSKVLLSNKNIIAIWTCWEPNAFDGKDSEYAGQSFYDMTGRFVPYLYKDANGYQIEALVDYEDPVAGEYYQGARDTGKPYITDPYAYQVGNTEISICSLAFPILHNGRTAGVVGVDIDLEDFMTLMNSTSILDDGYLFTLSPSGVFATHVQEEVLMSSYQTTWLKDYSAQIGEVLTRGGSFSIEAYSDISQTNVSVLGSGVLIGDTGRYWLIGGLIPQKTVNASSSALLAAIIGMGVALIVIVSAVNFGLFRSRLKGLPKLTAAAEAIAAGEIDLDDLDTGTESTKNELTLLERAFSEMVSGIKQQSHVLSRISEGDYAMSVRIRSDKDVMNQAICNMLDSTNQTLQHINSAAGQVNTGSRQIADSAQALAKGAMDQASSIEELSTSINEITVQTEENAKIAKEAAVLSNGIREKAEKGNVQMEQLMSAVADINEASNQIEKVIQVIDDIAFQTNILALNAAVEAARAGKYGKGFAVVAEEVRNLAAKSAQSAKDTSIMIENSKEKAGLGLVMANETSQSLKDIIEGIIRSTDIVAQIAQASDEQASAIEQINTGIEQVSCVVQQNSAVSEESASAAEEMSEQSELLTQLTSQFILRDSARKLNAPEADF